MLVPLVAIEVVGLRRQLPAVLAELHRLRVVHLIPAATATTAEPLPVSPELAAERAELVRLGAGLDGLLALAAADPADSAGRCAAGPVAATPVEPATPLEPAAPLEPGELDRVLGDLGPRIDVLSSRLEALQAEAATLPRYLHALRAVLPLVPDLATLGEEHLAQLDLVTLALVLDARDEAVVDLLRTELRAALGDRFDLTAARTDPQTVGCVLVVPATGRGAVDAVLGHEQVLHVPLPAAYEGLSLPAALAAMERRLAAIPAERARVERERADLVAAVAGPLAATRAQLRARLEQAEAAELAGGTSRTFVLAGWAPVRELPALRWALDRLGQVVVTERPADAEQAPVLLRNRPYVRPYQRLVGFLALPRPGTLDPSGLMALLLPVLFGVMVGDVGYGLALLGIAVAVRRRYAERAPFIADLARVLRTGAIYAVIFGLLFGEFLGSLGNTLGMPALWFYRGGPDALVPLLGFALAIGAAHVVLGLGLGIWQEARRRRPRGVADRLATLLVLGGLLALAGVATVGLPRAVITRRSPRWSSGWSSRCPCTARSV